MKKRVSKTSFAILFAATLLFATVGCSTEAENDFANDEIMENEQDSETENFENVRCIHRTGGEIGHLTVKARNPRNSRNSNRRR